MGIPGVPNSVAGRACPFPTAPATAEDNKGVEKPPVLCLSEKGQHIPGNVLCPCCHPQLHPPRMSLCPEDGSLDMALLIPEELPALGTLGRIYPSCPKPHSG